MIETEEGAAAADEIASADGLTVSLLQALTYQVLVAIDKEAVSMRR